MPKLRQTEHFLKDALPLIYRTHLDGGIVLLEGGFRSIFTAGQIDAFKSIHDVLAVLDYMMTH